ncbi:hypothetical protein ACWCPF_15145 [Streptomyces sp. NPDC001858]
MADHREVEPAMELMADHREVEEMFARIQELPGGRPARTPPPP